MRLKEKTLAVLLIIAAIIGIAFVCPGNGQGVGIGNGQDEEFVPPGQGGVPPGQDVDWIPPGQDPEFVPPGQDVDVD